MWERLTSVGQTDGRDFLILLFMLVTSARMFAAVGITFTSFVVFVFFGNYLISTVIRWHPLPPYPGNKPLSGDT